MASLTPITAFGFCEESVLWSHNIELCGQCRGASERLHGRQEASVELSQMKAWEDEYERQKQAEQDEAEEVRLLPCSHAALGCVCTTRTTSQRDL